MKYPDMVVEKRVSTTAHGLRPPIKERTGEYTKQLQDTIELCEGQQDGIWSPNVLHILEKYAPVKSNMHIPFLMEELGFASWKEVCDFVRHDECIEFMVRVAKYCKERYEVNRDKGFIDGEGVGLYKRYTDRLDKVMEKTFDAKYYFAAPRPLEFIKAISGLELSCIANYIHPGHNRYPAGHATKFYEAVDMALDTWMIDDEGRADLILGAYVASMGRSGILVHIPEDNIASGYLCGLKEFSDWKAN